MRKLKVLIGILFIVLALTACTKTKKDVEVTGVTLHGNTEMFVGETQTLNVEIFPADATNKELIWASLNEKVLKVENGVVTALAKGTAMVVVESSNGIATSLEIKVSEKKEEIKALDFEAQYNLELVEGSKTKVTVVINPKNSTDQPVFESLTSDVITISNTGEITALKLGEGKFKVTVGEIVKEFTINVIEDIVLASDVQKLLNDTFDYYKNDLIISALLTISNNDKVSSLSYKHEFTNDNVVQLEVIDTGEVIGYPDGEMVAIEYLENESSAYIDTEYIINSDTIIDSIVSIDNNNYVIILNLLPKESTEIYRKEVEHMANTDKIEFSSVKVTVTIDSSEEAKVTPFSESYKKTAA